MGRSSATSARSRRSASSPRKMSSICFQERSVRRATSATRAGMLVSSALAPDGSPVDGFEFEGRTVRYRGDEPVDAGIRVALDVRPTDDPQWLVPGVFYGENRPENCTRMYPGSPERTPAARRAGLFVGGLGGGVCGGGGGGGGRVPFPRGPVRDAGRV